VDGHRHGVESAAEGGALNIPRITGVLRVQAAIAKRRESSSVVKLYLSDNLAFQQRINKTLRIREEAEKSTLWRVRVRKVYQENRREERQTWIPDWRVILGDLRRKTLQHGQWFDKAVSISVPENACGKLLHAVDDNIWDIAEEHACSVALARNANTGQYDEFILSGSGLAISKAAAEVMRIAPGSKLKNGPQVQLPSYSDATTPVPTTESNDEPSAGPILRFVKSELRSTPPAIRAEMIPRPSEWTTQSFADYVDTLTSMRMPNHNHHLLYKKGEEHVKTVIKILRELFTDPECKSSLSRTAFKKALDYFVKTSNISDARATFVLMDMTGIRMDPETFNILLRGAAKNEDLHNFHFVLHLMIRRGISPNGRTWTAFLMANHDFRIKPYIVAGMQAKGLLAHPTILREVCQELVIREVNASLDLEKSHDEFLDHMDSRYGKDWLTVDNGNRVLHALGSRNLISRCWEFLQAMDARFVRIDHVSVNTILNHCKQQTNVVGAIEIMRLLPSLVQHGIYEPDQYTYHALFELAWRTKSYNLARVVWKYALWNAGTTSRMRTLVAQSLMNAARNPEPEISQARRWKQQAGLVITSDFVHHPIPELGRPSNENSNEPQSGLELQQAVGWKEANQAVSRHLERDHEKSKSWIPTAPFGEKLMQAWEQDRNWQRFRMRSEGGENVDWKIREAIVVPVVRHPRRRGKEYVQDWK
jgi:pentatricopeptide repeat protein